MQCNFPEIFPGKDQTDEFLLIKVLQELSEFGREKITLEHQALEAIDVLHAAETLVRKFFARNPNLSFEEMKAKAIAKNRERGYYKGVDDV
jgi:hypothetical protein